MAETSRASLGFVTSYGAAKRGGYTGTYEEWCALMATVADHLEENRQIGIGAAEAKAAAIIAEQEAETAALNAEAWAKGTKDGSSVPVTDPAYQNNAKYYSDKAAGYAERAEQAASVEVKEWLDEHPEATTTVQDDSLTEAKFTDALKLKTIKEYVTPEMFGAVGDGETDDTTALQESLDSGFNVQLTSGAVYLVDYLNLNGADGVTIFGNGLLKRIDSGSSYSILTVNNCNNITIEELNTDGNIANNGVTVNENKQSLTVKNSTNIFIGTLNDHNPAGDTLYVSNVKKLSINNLISVSDSYTGRNALSIISGEDIYVNNLISVKTGYYTMPSGIDLEPNNSSESIKRVFINNAYIDSDGTYGFSISNVSAKADISDITIAKCYITKAEKISDRHNSCVILTYANRVKGSFVCRQTGTNVARLDDGLNFGSVTDSDIYLDCDNAQRGIANNGKLKNITVKAIITNTYQNAMQVNNGDESTNVVFDVAIGDFGLSGSGAGFMVSSGSTASGIVLSGDLSKKTYGSQCLRFEGAIINIVADGLDMTGWTASNKVYGAQAASGGFVGRNCKNYNYLSAIPTGYDGYTKGTIVMNTNPTAGGYVGWVCVESGKTGTWKGFGEIAS